MVAPCRFFWNMSRSELLRRFPPVYFPSRRVGKASTLLAAALVIFCTLCLWEHAGTVGAAESRSLQRQITEEQARAKARRASLARLTTEERGLNVDLALAEDKIFKLEDAIAKQEERLALLAASDETLQARDQEIRKEQAKTREAMAGVLRVLWELHARSEGIKGRDFPDWPVTDREHRWSTELFAILDAYRVTLEGQQKDLEDVAMRRATLEKEIVRHLASLNNEKAKLLQTRVSYEQRLAVLRKQKLDTGAELESILELVRSLNLQVREIEARGNIANAKGKLPWPVPGVVRTRFNLSANPPARGLTIGLPGNLPVRAVHGGTVVHNDVLRGIGRVVVLLHGEEYYSLYASLSESPLVVGQEVARGDRVGTSGFVTTINGPGLYFELRFHQKAINPEQWLEQK